MSKTKCVVLGQREVGDETLKPIVFDKLVSSHGDKFIGASCRPDSFDNVILLKKGGGSPDQMYAYNDAHPNSGYVYLGHWNDGVV